LVPRDVEQSRLKTVKHEFIARLEQATAPRVVEFWEQDPCVPGRPEQAWEEKLAVKNRGFLTPAVMPPRDAHYPVSNELSIPSEPVFKGSEDEFSYRLLRPKSSGELRAWLEKRGYQPESVALERLFAARSADTQLLVAEVSVDHAELVDAEQLQLGGIRYWSRQPLLPISGVLDGSLDRGRHDLFVYSLERARRYQMANLKNVFAPTNLRVTAGVGAKVGLLYNTLFERLRGRQSRVAVTEYVGPSDECGEPCANAPLELRELLTLGGDVLEAHTVSPQEQRGSPVTLSEAEERRLTAEWAALPAAAALTRKRQHQELQKQLGAKRALVARHRYVVSRMHVRADAEAMPRDLALSPVDAQPSGGYGVPRGPNAELEGGVASAKSARYQVRFHAAHAWQGALPCAKPERWRWGKRWKSHDQHWRGVDVARDLARLGQDAELLESVLLSSVPQIGFEPRARAAPAPPLPAPALETSETSGCNLAPGAPAFFEGFWLLCAAAVAGSGRRSVRVRARAKSRR
jgi:hypothetical protein